LFKCVLCPISTGIGPEVFSYISSDGNFTGDVPPTADQLAFFKKHGYYITAPDYILRPEVLESNFHAFRVTGDPKYLDRAASAVDSFNTFLKTPTGFAGINDVDDVHTRKIDDTESFWFAEVLKYLWVFFPYCIQRSMIEALGLLGTSHLTTRTILASIIVRIYQFQIHISTNI
jgi:hypothetical protein